MANAPPTAPPARQRLSQQAYPVRFGFDSAQTNDDNKRHWANADSLSADAAHSPIIRRTLRNRCRYETFNNSYARGVSLTLAHDAIGTGPRLQLLTDDAEYNRRTERDFLAWTLAVNFAAKLRTLRLARVQDGEGFGHLFLNPAVDHAVKLDLQLIEAERVCCATLSPRPEEEATDGILLDEHGNPVAYSVLKFHPGDGDQPSFFGNITQTVRAREMVHYSRAERPGQHRGIPEITPALPLFAQLRRFTLAVISAAEAAADFAGILYTDVPARGEADAIKAMDKIPLHRNMLVTMPGGWKMGQIDPKQPASTYAEFKREILNEIARCLNMPFNVAACNSSGYNYASGRLDHQTYFKSLRVDQHGMGVTVLDPVLRAWLECYGDGGGPLHGANAYGAILPPHTWFWDGVEHVDPSKEATALFTKLSCGATSFPAEFARQGKDYETEMESQAGALGVSLAEYQALLRQKLFGPAATPGQPAGHSSTQDFEEEDR